MTNQFCSYSICTRHIEHSRWYSEHKSSGFSFSSSLLTEHPDYSHRIGVYLDGSDREPDTLLKDLHRKQGNEDRRLSTLLQSFWSHEE
jgi:hypothetical protein